MHRAREMDRYFMCISTTNVKVLRPYFIINVATWVRIVCTRGVNALPYFTQSPDRHIQFIFSNLQSTDTLCLIRLGADPVLVSPGTLAAEPYRTLVVYVAKLRACPGGVTGLVSTVSR